MTSASDETSSPSQLALFPELETREQSEVDKVFIDLEAHKITPERAVDRLMALYQKWIGSAARQLAELHKDNGLEFGRRLRKTVDTFMQEHGEVNSATADTQLTHAADDRARKKSKHILEREHLILSALIRSDQEQPLSTLFELVHSHDADVTEAAVIAHLDRLIKEGVIERKRKGLYRGIRPTREHLEALTEEMDVRGVKRPHYSARQRQ